MSQVLLLSNNILRLFEMQKQRN